MKYQIGIGDKKFEIDVGEISGGVARVNVNGADYEVVIENYTEITAALGQPGIAQVPPVMMAASPTPAPAAKPRSKPVAPAASSPSAATPSPIPAPAVPAGAGAVLAPIPGLILDVKVKVKDPVSAGQTVATMEAMKMENNIVCNINGTVKEVLVQKGSEVATGDTIMIID